MNQSDFRDQFARSLRVPQRTAFEYERVLRGQLGFPQADAGRGRGAVASPQGVAVFLLAVAASGAVSHAAETVVNYHEMLTEGADDQFRRGEPKAKDIIVCPLTGERSFGPALTAVLSDPEKAALVARIEITRDWPEAVIEYRAGDGLAESRFADLHERFAARRGTLPGAARNVYILGGELIEQIAQALQGSREIWAATTGMTD